MCRRSLIVIFRAGLTCKHDQLLKATHLDEKDSAGESIPVCYVVFTTEKSQRALVEKHKFFS